jgi:protoporphyrinogen oxidase
VKTAILGCGLTGLTIAHLLNKKGIEFKLFEKETNCGGLMRTLKQSGFTFDCGGSHVIFSKDKEALSFLLGLLGKNKRKRRRNTKVLYKGCYIKYPFENGLAGLSEKENFECLYSFVQNLINKQKGKRTKPKNLKDWFYYTFGDGITEKYLIPYNTKIWKYPIDKMSPEWVNRIPNPPLEDIIKSSLGIKTEGYVHQLNFYYPIRGGIQTLIDKLIDSIRERILVDFEIRKIGQEGNKWRISDGKQEELCDKIVSTIPVNELVKAMTAPKEVKEAASNLKYNSLICVMIGLDIKKISKLSWLYIPNRDILPHRVSFPSNYSQHVTPLGKSSVLAEITCTMQSKIWEMADYEIVDRVIDDLAGLKILDKKHVCFSVVRKTKYAYVLNDLNFFENIQRIKEFLFQEGIDTIGRFGEFRYLNMDACVRRAIEYVNSVAFCKTD